MKKYYFEILPNGDIGARYFFDTDHEIPPQQVRPGSSLQEFSLRKDATKKERKDLAEIFRRSKEFRFDKGKIKRR